MNKDFWKVPVALSFIATTIIMAGVLQKSFLAAFVVLGVWVVYFLGLYVQDRIIEKEKEKE